MPISVYDYKKVCSGGQTGPLIEILKRRRIGINSGPRWKHSPQVPWPPRPSLPRMLCPHKLLGLGALGAHEEFRQQRIGGIEHTIGNHWLVSTNVVFENTTSGAVGKNELQGLLVILLHGLLAFASMGVERGYFVLSHPDPQ